ncbi:MAG: DUF5362 family protein [Candidatus Zixiibacteriota bacterium]
MDEKQNAENVSYSSENMNPSFNSISYEMEKLRPWLKFLGIVSIIYGALYAITIIGIIFAWIPIWLGILLLNSSKEADRLVSEQNFERMMPFIINIRKFFVITGVLFIISIAFGILAIVFYAIFGIAALAGIMEGLNY